MMSRGLRWLAHSAGRDDLTDAQLDELAGACTFLFGRLAALMIEERRELDVFLSATERDERYYSDRAARRRTADGRPGSVASQFSRWLREVFLTGEKLTSPRHNSHLNDSYCKAFDARIGERKGTAIFIWKRDVYAPRGDINENKRASRLVAPVEKFLRAKERAIGCVSSWGSLAKVIPVRHKALTGFLHPHGRGYGVASRAPADRPSVSTKLGAMLTGFFHDEPLTQAYSKSCWMLVGPRRLFVVVPERGSADLGHWLHDDHETNRVRELGAQNDKLQEKKRGAYEKYEKERRKAAGIKPRRKRTGKSAKTTRAKPDTKAINLQALYDMLERMTRANRD